MLCPPLRPGKKRLWSEAFKPILLRQKRSAWGVGFSCWALKALDALDPSIYRDEKKPGLSPVFSWHCQLRSERQVQIFQVFACFDQYQRTFVQNHGRWTLARHTHGLRFGGNRGLHCGNFGCIRVHPNQPRALSHLVQVVNLQGVAGDHGQACARCCGCFGGSGGRLRCWCRRCSHHRGWRSDWRHSGLRRWGGCLSRTCNFSGY